MEERPLDPNVPNDSPTPTEPELEETSTTPLPGDTTPPAEPKVITETKHHRAGWMRDLFRKR